MRPLFSQFLALCLALPLLPACGPATPPGECSESAKITGYRDEDGDGHGDPSTQAQVCEVGIAGWVSTGLDCDDTRSAVNPDSIEECDGLDNNCNNSIDESLRLITFYADSDGDAYGNIDLTTEACSPPPGFVENSSDCDDGDPLSFPGSTEFCDDEDNDCDGLIDDADPDIDPDSQPFWYLDGDGDTYGDPDTGIQRCDAPGPNAVDNDLDCNDSTPGISPDAQEVCDGIDNDCDGLIDDSDPTLNGAGMTTWYYDFDGDGLGDAGFPLQACNQPWFYVGDSSDCDDTDPFVLDSNSTFWRVDADGDTYGDPAIPSQGPSCTPPAGSGFTPEAVGDDCNDAVAAINPGATEICDSLDNDCDGLVDDLDDSLDQNSALTFYVDVDGDGFGDPTMPVEACTQPPNTVQDFTDCDDTDFDVHLGATEICNSIDDNCNGLADAADPTLDPLSAPNWYVDFDQDGFGCAQADCGATVACTQPVGLVDNDIDCDDNDPLIAGNGDWLADLDGDGFGSNTVVATGCGPFANAVPDLGPRDCDDGDSLAYPDADEICGDGIDQDCNGVDQACPPDTCADANLAVPLTSDTRYVDDLGAYANDVSFNNFNSCTSHPTSGGDAIIPVQIDPGDHFTAWMVGSGDSSLSLLSTCTAPNPSTDCKVGGDNIGVGGVETIRYTNLGAITQTLYLVADCNGACGDYELGIEFTVADLPDTCGDVVGVTPLTTGGYSLHDSLNGFVDDSDLGSLGCTGIDSAGGDSFIPVDLLAGETLTLDAYTQFLDDSSVYLISNCADAFGTCLVGSDNSGAGQSEALAYTNGGVTTERVYLTLDCYLPTCREFLTKFSIE